MATHLSRPSIAFWSQLRPTVAWVLATSPKGLAQGWHNSPGSPKAPAKENLLAMSVLPGWGSGAQPRPDGLVLPRRPPLLLTSQVRQTLQVPGNDRGLQWVPPRCSGRRQCGECPPFTAHSRLESWLPCGPQELLPSPSSETCGSCAGLGGAHLKLQPCSRELWPSSPPSRGLVASFPLRDTCRF